MSDISHLNDKERCRLYVEYFGTEKGQQVLAIMEQDCGLGLPVFRPKEGQFDRDAAALIDGARQFYIRHIRGRIVRGEQLARSKKQEVIKDAKEKREQDNRGQ